MPKVDEAVTIRIEPPAVLARQVKAREKRIVENIVEHALAQGEDLIKLQASLGGRKFAPYLEEHVGFSRQTAYKYIAIANNREVICNAGLQMGTLADALRLIKPDEEKEGTSSKGNSATGGKAGTVADDGSGHLPQDALPKEVNAEVQAIIKELREAWKIESPTGAVVEALRYAHRGVITCPK